MLKFAIYGLSGSGKSSTGKLIKDYFEAKNMKTEFLKLAYPLYQIQKIFYDTAGKKIDFYDQDQILLEIIAENLRRISKTALVDDFISRLKLSTADVVINDDIRDYNNDYPILKRENFIFFKIFCDEDLRIKRIMQRKDISIKINSATTRDIDKFESDWVVDSSANDLEIMKGLVHNILNKYTI